MTTSTIAGDIQLVGLTKKYGASTALNALDLHIPAGSLTVIVGPSGCGKSTLLRVLSGLETATDGELLIGGLPVAGQDAGDRDVAMVFQDYALYPHMTVAANLSFGLRLQARHDRRGGPSKAEIAQRVAQVGGLLGLDKLLHRRPAELSGGQRQRVALGRAIIRRPGVLLLDEPLSALDSQLRASARGEILRLHREIGATLVLVTHDQHEALSMATHLVVMDAGAVAQSGTPEELFHAPATEFVATFVGSPAMNLQPEGDGRVGWRASDARISMADAAGATTPDGLVVEGTTETCEFTGDGQQVTVRTGERVGERGERVDDRSGDRSGDRTFIITQREGERWLRVGDPVRAVIPPSQLHHFDRNGLRRNA
ncbi:multiple sugar transport system ATP-binding protein [Glaciihabitans tibetensis]|uniref:Multiple sugar transport system ATP-binding protein n=1 Tax=Glaciihabitans tibetensis TaxID=1266600 RepID=A0A2T0V5K2_9MICO|nr:ABC transporter ATP-binding protein [Glaciihabitans tibetensis]PRY65433.1 multiple sugar transport system ATP-binding protein [Glaciihabitans tibetensis]